MTIDFKGDRLLLNSTVLIVLTLGGYRCEETRAFVFTQRAKSLGILRVKILHRVEEILCDYSLRA